MIIIGAEILPRESYIFTSESVSEGHPDKVCDRISDAVLDAFISLEPEARVACETFATTNRVVVGGEVGLSDKNLSLVGPPRLCPASTRRSSRFAVCPRGPCSARSRTRSSPLCSSRRAVGICSGYLLLV